MPYALVELTDARGCKELVPVPETWIEQRGRAISYLCWPNTKNINILNMLVADEQSKPSPIWETHKCEVKRTSIPSFLLAGKMANIRQKLFKPKPTTQSQQEESTFSMYTCCDPKQENEEIESSNIVFNAVNILHTDPLNCLDSQSGNEFAELKNLIIQNHVETKNNLSYMYRNIQKSLQSIVHNVGAEETKNHSTTLNVLENDLDHFELSPVTSIEEMNSLENLLEDADYRKHSYNWIDKLIYDKDPETRLITALDLVFEKRFLIQFSWTGCSRQKEVKKYAMRSYKNILQFFAHAGSTSTFRVGPKFLAMFFMNRLKYASKRALNKGLRKCTPHRSKKRKNNADLENRWHECQEADSNSKFVSELE